MSASVSMPMLFWPVNNSDYASSLSGFSNYYFQRVSCGGVNGAYFRYLLDFVKDVQWVSVFYVNYEAVAAGDFKGFLGGYAA